jgi:tetratricopeptide (TPR) repeat protein
MHWLPAWLGCGLLWCVCPVLAGQQEDEAPAAESLWEQGQKAMHRGHPEQAVVCYQQSLEKSPALTCNHLSLAAALLELGKTEAACIQLGKYVAANAGDIDIRLQYAELLARLHQDREARAQFERCVRDAQEQAGEAAAAHLIHCHSRLMEIAEAAEDSYEEHLNRGIGLYLLARQATGVAEAEGEVSSESLYCKAAGELTLARRERPEEARPLWYLYGVWSRLAQRPPAQSCLNDAKEAAPFSYLTPVEQRGLHLASQSFCPCAK